MRRFDSGLPQIGGGRQMMSVIMGAMSGKVPEYPHIRVARRAHVLRWYPTGFT